MTTNPFLQPPDPSASSAPEYGAIVKGRYYLPHPHTMQPHMWTRTTNYCKKIADEWAINEWEKQTIVAGLTLREDLYAEACAAVEFVDGTQDLTPEAKKDLNSIIDRAKEVAGGNTGARMGTAIHAFTERAKQGRPHGAPRKWAGKVDLYLDTLRKHSLIPQPHLLERRVISIRYNLAGTFDDGLLSPEFGLVIGDTKSQKAWYSYDQPAMQLAMYANADCMWNKETGAYEDIPSFNKEVGLIVWLPVRHDDADVRRVDIARGWRVLEVVEAVHEWQKAGKRVNEVGGLYVPNKLAINERYARRLMDADSAEDLENVRAEACGFAYWCGELEDSYQGKLSTFANNDLVSTVDSVSTVH